MWDQVQLWAYPLRTLFFGQFPAEPPQEKNIERKYWLATGQLVEVGI